VAHRNAGPRATSLPNPGPAAGSRSPPAAGPYRLQTGFPRTAALNSDAETSMNEHPDPYAVLGVTPTATRRRSPTPFAPSCEPFTPTHAQRPLATARYDKCWPPMGCCVTPTAAPITTAPPPSPPRPRTDQVRRRHGAHLRILLGQFRSRSHTTAKKRRRRPHNAHCGQGRCAGTPNPAQPSQAKPSRTDGAMLHAVKQRPPDALTQ
jgi:hypothetical protein